MKNWLTIHDPHPKSDLVKWDIYLQNKYSDLASEIAIGDRVFFYETKTTKQRKLKGCIGRMGIVHIGYVTGAAYTRKNQEALSVYIDGEQKFWRIGIPTNAENSSGFVPQSKVVEILDYAKTYYFKGFAGGKGIKQIDSSEANALQELFDQY